MNNNLLPLPKQSNFTFYASVVLFTIFMLIMFSFMKEYEDKIIALESVKTACIETNVSRNPNETHVFCGKIVK